MRLSPKGGSYEKTMVIEGVLQTKFEDIYGRYEKRELSIEDVP